MTTTEHIESFKANLQTSAQNIRRGLSGRAVLGTLVVLATLFLVGMLPRWRANAALTSAAPKSAGVNRCFINSSHFFGSFRTEPWASVVLFSGAAQYSSVVPSQRGMGLLMGLLRPRPVENASS